VVKGGSFSHASFVEVFVALEPSGRCLSGRSDELALVGEMRKPEADGLLQQAGGDVLLELGHVLVL
jgi:hypothetical protein